MGLLNWLVNLGIGVMDNTERDIQRIGQRLGFMPLSWRQIEAAYNQQGGKWDGLLCRIPGPITQNSNGSTNSTIRTANSLSRIQAILVSEYERALVLKDGVLIDEAVLPPGLYDVTRTVQVRGQIEVIWLTTREFQLRWGVGDIMTIEGVSIGASGYYNAAIMEPVAFVRNVAGNAYVYTEKDLFTFAKSTVSNAIRNLMAQKTVKEFQLSQEEIAAAVQEKLQLIFERWGMEFRGLTIETQNIPEEFRQAAAARVQVQMIKAAELEGATSDVTLAQLEAQRQFFLAQAKATERYVTGDAEVEIMRRQIAVGLNPLQLKAAEAMELFAITPSQGALIDSRAQIIAQLSSVVTTPSAVPFHPTNPVVEPTVGPHNPQMPTIGSTVPTHLVGTIPTSPTAASGGGADANQGGLAGLAPFVPPIPPNSASGPASTPALSGPLSGSGSERDKIEAMLDQLDERFVNGELTEQTYLMMRDRWQKKLEKLP